MKKNIRGIVLRLVVTFLVASVSLFGYIDVYSEEQSVALLESVTLKEEKTEYPVVGAFVKEDIISKKRSDW